jgi:succinate-acetate transporter protein
MAEPEARVATSSALGGIADPAPLGLAGFALTTFLLSADNAHLIKGTGTAFLGYALAYGGIVQLLAGMWEFRRNNTFGATAFSTYGAFWLGLWFYFVHGGDNLKDLGWILLGFAIINTYLLVAATRVNAAVVGVFLVLEITEILLVIGFLGDHVNVVKAAGWAGIVTAAVAWYTSFAGLFNSFGVSRRVLPVGRPMNL